jgi:methylamine dehydrogenase heavy chain
LVCALCSAAASAELKVETLSVAKLAPPTPHRIYLADVAIGHIVDGRLHVIDGDSLKYLGVIPTGYAGQFALSPDRRELYVATTYYSRLSRGERTDVVEIYDPLTLEYRSEIVIPARRAQALPYEGIIRTSRDGRWLFVQNATPATSISVVDLKARKFVAEVPNPGCWIVLPSQTAENRFATLCGDGTLQTVVLNDDGSLKSRSKSARFFDPDEDPVFVHSAAIGDRHYFVSYKGLVHAVDLSDETPRFETPWSLVGKEDARQAWRPGGYQLFAIHETSQRMFVAMHKRGAEGSHKNPADEIWIVDLAAKKRIGHLPGNGAVAMAVSQKAAPRLFALDGMKMGIAVFDAGDKPRLLKRMEQAAESATLLELH